MEIRLKSVIKVICLVAFCDLVEYLRFNTSDYLARVIEPNEKISVEIQTKLKVDLLYNSTETLLDTDPEDFITYEK